MGWDNYDSRNLQRIADAVDPPPFYIEELPPPKEISGIWLVIAGLGSTIPFLLFYYFAHSVLPDGDKVPSFPFVILWVLFVLLPFTIKKILK